jgi:catechol 2,3-dioxygenase-like lactoylglutathione lyase family enzyme
MQALSYVFTHVHVYASNPEATVKWLTDGLGGEVVRRRQQGDYPVTTQVSLGGQIIQVRGRRESERFVPAGDRSFGWDHIGLSVIDLDATLAALRDRGITPVTTFDNGFRVPEGIAFLRGPDGIWVEIASSEHAPPPEVVLARHEAGSPSPPAST